MFTKKNYAIFNKESIEVIKTTFNNKEIDFSKMIPVNFKGKLTISIEVVDEIKQSVIYFKQNPELIINNKLDRNSSVFLDVKTMSFGLNDYYNEVFNPNVNDCEYISIFTSLDKPFIANGDIPNDKITLVDMAQILNFHIILSVQEFKGFSYISRQVFDSYSMYGFVIMNIDEFDKFISSKACGNDLIEEFTTTELANEIFDEGLMILSWGHTPWVYYINSSNQDLFSNLYGIATDYEGFYKLKSENKIFNVIPGNELKNWNACKGKSWPEIEIEGVGDYVNIKLYVKEALSLGEMNYPIPTFHINRVDHFDAEKGPLLYSNIVEK